MNSNWVDFRELRQKLRFIDVLKSYGVQLKIRGDRATGFCPLPGHPRHEGKRRTPSFSAHLGRGLFNCFGCQAKGNQIDFACYMSGVDPEDPASVRRVALDLQSRFLGNDGGRCDEASAARPTSHVTVTTPEIAVERPSRPSALPIIVNEPLQFTLKQLDAEHPYLRERGLTAQTIFHFGLGYCARGLMKGRIAIPLHDAANRLVGYAGRVVDDAMIDEENPKYRFPSAREREGKVYEFQKGALLYHSRSLAPPLHDLVVVEGFVSVWWLWQCGIPNVVAVMGSSCSDEQGRLMVDLVVPDGRVWILPDADSAGEHCAESVLLRVAQHRFVRWVKLVQGQPTDLSAEETSRRLQEVMAPSENVSASTATRIVPGNGEPAP